MNILVWYSRPWRGGRAGGAETHVAGLISGLSARGHHVVLTTADDDETKPDVEGTAAHYGIRYQVLNPVSTARAYKKLGEIVARHRIDIIHAHYRTAGYFAETMYRRRGVPYVVTVHDPWMSAPLKGAHAGVFRRMIAVSEFIKRGLVRRFRIPGERIRVIHNGTDPGRFECVDAREAARFRCQFGVRDEVALTLVARIGRVKGHYDLVHALRALPRDLNYKCLIVGEGKARGQLEGLARKYGLAGKIVFCGYQADIPVVMAASDVVLLPSYREPCPLAIVEAMLSRKAVIASSSGGIPELISDGIDGLLFPTGNVAALAASMEKLVHEVELRNRLSQAAYQTATRRFLLSGMIEKTEQYYREITAASDLRRDTHVPV